MSRALLWRDQRPGKTSETCPRPRVAYSASNLQRFGSPLPNTVSNHVPVDRKAPPHLVWCRERVDTFQVPLVAGDIETLSIADLKCSELNDQLYLRSVIANKFRSVQAFNRMVQVRTRYAIPSYSSGRRRGVVCCEALHLST